MKREREPVPNAQVARSHRESADVSLIDSTVLGGRVGRERGKEAALRIVWRLLDLNSDAVT